MNPMLTEIGVIDLRYGVIVDYSGAGEMDKRGNAATVNAVRERPERLIGFLGIGLASLGESPKEARDLMHAPGVVGSSIELDSSGAPA